MSDLTTQRLCYTDSYLVRFAARVVERLAWDGHPAVVLDRTAFYPTSGGQPSDRGALDSVPVIGVEVREADGAVVHILAEPGVPLQVVGQVDWERRFDHMQQHTGQHILSAACEKLLDADTVSFHLGVETCTIDLNVARMPLAALEPVEERANRVIWEDRPVTARVVEPSQLAGLPLRRAPKVEGPVRLIEIADFDLNPCGGTHVARTGEIGLLKILRLDYRGAETRVEFVCGGRALRDYRRKNETVFRLSAALTVGQLELEEAIGRLQEDLKGARRELRAAQEQALEAEAAALVQAAQPIGPLRVILGVWEGRDPGGLRALAQRVVARPATVVLLASVGERVHLCVACAEEVEVDAVALLRAVLEPLGGKGGGQAHMAQGSAPAAPLERVQALLSTLPIP